MGPVYTCRPTGLLLTGVLNGGQLDADQEVAVVRRGIETLDGQDVVAQPQFVDLIREIDGFESHRRGVVAADRGGRVPGGIALEIAPGDLPAVEVGDETIVVLHLQDQVLQLVLVAVEPEGNPDIARAVDVDIRLTMLVLM